MGFTLKGAVGFGTLAAERKRTQIALEASATRAAFGANKDQFKEFLKELEDGNQ